MRGGFPASTVACNDPLVHNMLTAITEMVYT